MKSIVLPQFYLTMKIFEVVFYLICKSAMNGERQIGQLLAWNIKILILVYFYKSRVR